MESCERGIQSQIHSNITLIEGGVTIEDDLEVAEIFNSFFVKKIETLKDNRDVSMIEDPLNRHKQKMKPKNLKFKLKQVSEKTVLKAIRGMKNKKALDLMNSLRSN